MIKNLLGLLAVLVVFVVVCFSASADARRWALRFNQLQSTTAMAVSPRGEVFIASEVLGIKSMGGRIYKLSLDGSLSVVAGSGVGGYADGPALEAQFRDIGGIAFDRQGQLVIADTENHVIRRLSRDLTLVTTIAGDQQRKTRSGRPLKGFKDGHASEAHFNRPQGLAIDSRGTIFVADSANNVIRAIDNDQVSTFAGPAPKIGAGDKTARPANTGWATGPRDQAFFSTPTILTVAGNDDVIVGETYRSSIHRISRADNIVRTVFDPHGRRPNGVAVIRNPATHSEELLTAFENSNEVVQFFEGSLKTINLGLSAVYSIAAAPHGGFWVATQYQLIFIGPEDAFEAKLVELKKSAATNATALTALTGLANRQQTIDTIRRSQREAPLTSHLAKLPHDLIDELYKLDTTTARARWALMASS